MHLISPQPLGCVSFANLIRRPPFVCLGGPRRHSKYADVSLQSFRGHGECALLVGYIALGEGTHWKQRNSMFAEEKIAFPIISFLCIRRCPWLLAVSFTLMRFPLTSWRAILFISLRNRWRMRDALCETCRCGKLRCHTYIWPKEPPV